MTEPTPDQIPCLDGLKFISMIWVVSGHQYSITVGGPLTNTKYLMEWADSLYSMFLISGTLSVDTFLTIGGTLMSYGFMKAKYKKVPFNVFLYYFHRYLRLTAPFALVVLVSSTLLVYMGSGPKWPYVKIYFQQNCVDYWWSALLYVQNYVNVSHMCLGQTWYLSIDMQLYIISPLVFLALWKWPKICLPILGLCTLGFMATAFYIAWVNDLTVILSNLYGNATDYSNKYYLLTHTRATPWVIGVILGYYIFKIKQNEIRFRLHKFVALMMWAICLATLLTCVLGGHGTLRGKEYDRMGNSFHIAFVRPVWSIAISWIILACITNYGGPINWILSLPIYQVLNRFTYSIYLTHVTMLYMIIYNKKWPDYFSDLNMAYQFWGTLWFSTGLSFLLVFVTESPMIIIEKMLFVVDASSKVQSGIMSLNIGELGNFEQCISTKGNLSNGETVRGKYCLGHLSMDPEEIQKYTAALGNRIQEQLVLQKKSSAINNLATNNNTMIHGPTWAGCFPDGCSTQDINKIVNQVIESFMFTNITIVFEDMLCQTEKDVHSEFTSDAIFTMYINEVISMMWVVIGHQYSITCGGPVTSTVALMKWADSLHSMFIISGTISVDTFLVIGAFLLTIYFLKEKKKNRPIPIYKFYLQRYLRLTPSLAAMVLISATLLVYLGSGPRWPFVKPYFQDNCVNYWWSTLLYIQNYVNVKNMKFSWLIWIICLAILLTCVLIGHHDLRQVEYDKWKNALYIALVRPAWAIGICWVIYACATDNGAISKLVNSILGYRNFQIMGRFTYAVYLVHVTLMYLISFARKSPIYFSDFEMIQRFWGSLFLSLAL
ncbi:nose resistant to fluoxetine protein 6-like, partial [Asbolus verrucosus]